MICRAITEHFRCSESYADFALTGPLSEHAGYFRFGPDTICYGRTSVRSPRKCASGELQDLWAECVVDGSEVRLPFDPTEVAENWRLERYSCARRGSGKATDFQSPLRAAYYYVRPLLPVCVRKHLQALYLNDWRKLSFPQWPVDHSVESLFERILMLSLQARQGERIPFIWFWPDGAPSCAMLTHDVETARGRDFCSKLMDIDEECGIKASFQIVPEGRYQVPESFLSSLRSRGVEINIQDLNHDGHLFEDRAKFLRRAERINRYAREYGAAGFRAGVLYRNTEWYGALEFSYDMSVPSVGHLDPQRGGCCTVMPYFIGNILELPVTTIQDYSLFHILNDFSIELWKRQIALISEKHGLASFIVHPDYITQGREQGVYLELLAYLTRLRAEQKLWIALPGEIASWWVARSNMTLVRNGATWGVQGPGSDRARVAFACLDGQLLSYELDPHEAATNTR